MNPKILLFSEQKGCGFIFLCMISIRGHFKDARSTLTEDRSRVFSSKIFSQCSLSLPENIAGSRSIKSATDAKPGRGGGKKQTIFSAHLWSEDNTGPEAHVVKQFQS